jgi:hypothetical protein
MSAVEAGPTVAFPTRREPQAGAQLEARAGIGFSNREALKTWGMEGSSKIKLTSATQNLALGDGFYFARSTKGGDTTAMVRGGVHFVVERYEDKVFIGAGPYAAITVGLPLSSRVYQTSGIFATTWRERTLVTMGPAIELDTRFARESSVVFFGLSVGIAWTEENLLIQPAPPRLRPNDPANTPPPY